MIRSGCEVVGDPIECLSCGADLPEASKFCAECGAAVRHICPACRHSNVHGARFCAECGFSLRDRANATVPADSTGDRPIAERRQITVMFCDLVGSTALSARLDPEDLRDVIAAYHERVSGSVKRFDGFVAKYMGDGVLAYFGFPQAHEDDAERAVRAALDIVQAVSGIERPGAGKLDVRIGIATGLVVVGDLIGEGSSQEQAVVGETPNLAARLQGLAESGTAVVSASTRRLLGNLFALRDAGRARREGICRTGPSLGSRARNSIREPLRVGAGR
jgi:class 3 adenylate cyclase